MILTTNNYFATAICVLAPDSWVWNDSRFDAQRASATLKPFFTGVYSVRASDGKGLGEPASVTVTVGDTLALADPRANFTPVASVTGFTLTDNLGSGGARDLTGFKRVRFSDVSVALDLDGVGGMVCLRLRMGYATRRVKTIEDCGGQAFGPIRP